MSFAGRDLEAPISGDYALRSLSGDSERSATLLAAALLFQMSLKQELSDRQFELFNGAYVNTQANYFKQIGREIRRQS